MSVSTVILFGSDDCIPCHTLKPQVESMLRRKRVRYLYIDVNESPEEVAKYQIQTLPTAIIGGLTAVVGAPNILRSLSLLPDKEDK